MPAGEKDAGPRRKWNLGILSDAQTDEVPGEYCHCLYVIVTVIVY